MVFYSNKDIIIENTNLILYFSYQNWDSTFFNRPCYYLNTEKSIFFEDTYNISKKIKSIFQNCFITAKIDSSYTSNILKILQKAGFYYVETEVQLKYQKGSILSIEKHDIEIFNLDENTIESYEELGKTFTHTRFHSDDNIPDGKADELWTCYIKNYIPDKNHFMFVANVKNKIAGVILANKNGNNLYLFYVAVIEEFQNIGVGTKLIQHVVNQFQDNVILTGTQIKNIQALNYYIKNNFSKIISTKTILHYW